jgi:hypothetical protein
LIACATQARGEPTLQYYLNERTVDSSNLQAKNL